MTIKHIDYNQFINGFHGEFPEAFAAYTGITEKRIPLGKCILNLAHYDGRTPLLIERESECDLTIINYSLPESDNTNFLFEVTGNITDDVMNHFNSLFKEVSRKGETKYDIATHDRMEYLKEVGCNIEFVSTVRSLANENLIRCGGLELPAIIAGMLKCFYYNNSGSRVSVLECINWLAQEDIANYGFSDLYETYYAKVANFLYCSFTGLRLGSRWNGRAEVNGGYIVVKRDGEVVAYHSTIADEFKDFLVHRLTMEAPSHSRHKDMVIEKMNGKYYLKLGLQLRFSMN